MLAACRTGQASIFIIQVRAMSADAILIVLQNFTPVVSMVHETFFCVVYGIIIAPVAIPSLPIPLLRVVSINPSIVNRRVYATRVILEPFPLEVVIGLDEAWLVVEAPCAV